MYPAYLERPGRRPAWLRVDRVFGEPGIPNTVRSQTTNGEAIRYQYEPAQLELMGRKENFDVIELPESVPNRLGRVPLEVLDLVVDSKGQKLIANPAHGGEQMTEEY